MRRGAFRRRLAAALAAALLAALLPASTAAANNGAGGTITASWAGRIDWTEVYDPSNPATELTTAGYSWTYSITVRSTASGGKVVGTPSFTFGGNITNTAAPPNQSADCTGTLSARPTAPVTQFGPVGIVWLAPVWQLDWFAPDTGSWVKSSANPTSLCANTPNSSGPSEPCVPRSVPQIVLRPTQLPWTRTYALSGVGTSPGRGVNCWVTGSSTITFSGSGAGGAKAPPPTPGRFRAKAQATIALEATYERMLYPCIATAATIPLYGLGPPGQVAALGIGAVAAPLCAAYLKEVNDLAAIVKDPPLDSFDLAARPQPVRPAAVSMAPCSQWSGSAATFCAQLEPRLLRLLAAVQKSQAVSAAMKTTIARESGALQARNNGAALRQDRILAGLDKRFASATAAETSAGAGVASVMANAGLPASLSASQAAGAASTVVARLAHLGLSRRALARILGAARVAAPIDWLAALSS